MLLTKYIKQDSEKQNEIKSVCETYARKDFKKIKDVEIRETFHNYDYIIIVNDYDTIIENSRLKSELAKIKGLKVRFDNFNNSFLREQGLVEKDDLIETSDREILNRPLIRNLKNRKLKFTRKDSIYLTNKIEMDYNEVKSYFLNIALSWQFNTDFEAIARKLKNAIPSQKQLFTTFKIIKTCQISTYGKTYNVCIVVKPLKFNNEYFNKELYKVFLPYNTLVLDDLVRVNIEELADKDDYGDWSPMTNLTWENYNKVINLQDC